MYVYVGFLVFFFKNTMLGWMEMVTGTGTVRVSIMERWAECSLLLCF